MPSEKELLERIQRLEAENNVLQDKLDMIWSILADQYESSSDEDDAPAGPNLVQIDRKGH
jgi:hypothetical protein